MFLIKFNKQVPHSKLAQLFLGVKTESRQIKNCLYLNYSDPELPMPDLNLIRLTHFGECIKF